MVNDTEPRSARNVAETPVDMLLRSVRGNRKDTLADSKQQVVERERGEAPAQFIGTRRRGIAAPEEGRIRPQYSKSRNIRTGTEGEASRAGMRDTVGNRRRAAMAACVLSVNIVGYYIKENSITS